MPASQRLLAPILGLGLLLPIPAVIAEDPPADSVTLKDGSKIIGRVTGSRDGALAIETGFAGALSIPLDKVASVTTAEPVVIKLADNTVIADQPLVIQEEQLMVVAQAPEMARGYALDQLAVVNPEPWELGQGYKWSGLASIALSRERGNTDTDEYDYKLETKWRSLQDRYTLKLIGELDEANGQKNADNWQARGKYDYFFDGPYYGGILLLAEHDKFADLDLRYLVGPLIGRQFYEEPILTLSAEVGISYVNEDYIQADDEQYGAFNWSVDFSSNYLGGDSRLYVDNFGVWNLEDTSDVIVNTTFGLAYPLLWDFEAAAEILLEYDSGAVDDVDELDQTYRFRIGYSW